MAYEPNDAARLKHLEDLAGRMKKVTDNHETRIDTIEKAGFQTEAQVDAKVKAAVAGALTPSGSVAFADLPALSKDSLNKIFNVSDGFTTTENFVEGAGKDYPAGTNVAIINVGTAESPVYKYDAYTGVIDTSGFMEKVDNAVAGKLVKVNADGSLEVTDIDAGSVLTEHQNINGKADKKVPSAAGNIATLDAEGNLADSGVKFATDAEVTEMLEKYFPTTSSSED